MSFEVPPSSIISDFRAMINDQTLSDVTFIVEGQEVYGHKLMLVRCSYFQSLFLGSMMESTQSTIRIEQVRHSMYVLCEDEVTMAASACTFSLNL